LGVIYSDWKLMRAKHIFLVLLLVVCSPTFAQYDWGIDKIATAERETKGKFLKSAQSVENDGVDVFYVDANWRVNPDNRFLAGTIHHSLRVNSNRNEISFDMDNLLSASKVMVNDVEVSKRAVDDVLYVSNVSGNFIAGQNYKITIIYQGSPKNEGFGSFATETHNNIPALWTLSEPFGARDWWPCRQNLFDKIDSLDVHVDIPEGNRAASNGVLQSVSPIPFGRVIYHWKHRYPIATYLVAIAVTNYDEVLDSIQLNTGKIQLQHYIYPENNTPQRQQELLNTKRFLQVFDSLFTPYPFINEKYGHAEFGWGGGMEHQTMSFMGTFQYDITAHELAHQWFGNQVTCRTWGDIWLNEGFATYLSGLMYSVDSPDLYWPIWKRNVKSTVIRKPNGSVFVPNAENESVNRIFDSRLTYYKGAMVLHMLRWTLGDEAFYQGIRNYLNDAQLKDNFARTQDLQKHLENTSGRNLGRFFEQWVYKEGHPTYQLEWNQQNPLTVIRLHQTQSDTTQQAGHFEVDLPVLIKNADHDTLVRLQNTYNGQVFALDLGFVPDSIILDPDGWIIMDTGTVVKNTNFITDLPVLFPNPSTGKLHILSKSDMSPGDISLLNSFGQYAAPKVVAHSDFLIQLDTSELSGGTYVVKLGSKVLGQFVKIP